MMSVQQKYIKIYFQWVFSMSFLPTSRCSSWFWLPGCAARYVQQNQLEGSPRPLRSFCTAHGVQQNQLEGVTNLLGSFQAKCFVRQNQLEGSCTSRVHYRGLLPFCKSIPPPLSYLTWTLPFIHCCISSWLEVLQCNNERWKNNINLLHPRVHINISLS